MHEHAIGKVFRQIGPQHINHKGRRALCRKHRDLRFLAHAQQARRRHLAIGQHQYRRLQGHNPLDAPRTVFLAGVGDVGDFTLTQNLHPVGVDVIEVTHQIGA